MNDQELVKKLVAKDEITVEEFNQFVQSNMVRNNFLPVMEHLCKLTKEFTIDEFADKEGNTTCVQFHIVIPKDEYGIDGRVGYDMYSYPDKKEMSYELWWGGECYCHLYKPIEIMNMISVQMGRAKVEDSNTYKAVRKADRLFPIV